MTATMVSVGLHTHHVTKASSVSCGSGMPHIPESMVKSEASQVDENYFLLALSLHKCLQHLPCAMA